MSYEDLLARVAADDPRIVVMTAENRAAIRSLPERLGERFIDVGIAEQTLIGAAAGLALRGRIPVVHALASFLTMRAFEFIRTDVGIPALPVKMVGAVPGFLSEANGPTHQALEDIALMRGIPGVNVFCPADDGDLIAGIEAIVADNAPWYVRYNARPKSVGSRSPFVPGKADLVMDGHDVAILTYGCLLREAQEAAEELRRDGLSVRLLNMRTLKPIDTAAVLAAARETSLVVTIEDHFLTGGLATIVAEIAAAHRVPLRLHPIAMVDRWFTPALLADVIRTEGFSGAQLAARIASALVASPVL